ncbi:MAG: hypothetical protein GXO04_05295 [Aquificae bacterium]|nr:hypothetical protein [Aquificota bacterium]
MKFFKGSEREGSSPERIKPLRRGLLVRSFVNTIREAGDEEDLRFFLESSARNLFSSVRELLEEVREENSVECFVSVLDLILSREGLGSLSVEIDKESRKLRVFLSGSPFLGALGGDKDCFFYEVFLSEVFSLLLGKGIRLREVSCAVGGDEGVCVFESV